MRNSKSMIILFLSSVLFAGCAGVDTTVFIPSDVHVNKGHHEIGPPPHAPAHGYRHRHHGVELEYSTEIGAYIVLENPDTYFYNGLYVGVSPEEHWVVAEHLGGPWRVAEAREVPPKLKRAKVKGKRQGKGKKKKKG